MTNIRPLSRSEMMLRETLRRAEHHDRVITSPFFLATPLKEDDDSDCECEDLDNFFGHRVGSPRSRSTRDSSIDQKRSVSPAPQRGSPRRASTASSSNEDALTPHDAVLRRRLEGVLSQARDQDRVKSNRSFSRPRAHTRESSEEWNVRYHLSLSLSLLLIPLAPSPSPLAPYPLTPRGCHRSHSDLSLHHLHPHTPHRHSIAQHHNPQTLDGGSH